jgi:hypothetical protein
MEEWTSFPIGSQWDKMEPFHSHTTTERTNRRQEEEFRMAKKRDGFAGLGKCEVVVGREPTCKG